MDDDPEATLAGQIGQYRVIQQIGRGGMGVVYLAQDSRLHRRVALKVLPAEFVRNKDRLHRFEQEARAASALNHPNILTIHEVGEADGQHFIATEYIEGIALRQRMAGERMELPEVLEITTQVASALAAAHQAGIVHRDIKPENIMIRPDGFIKVLDFGLAKLTEQEARATDPEAATVPMVKTESGIVMGTATYMSPEQARGQDMDGRTDIWSLGVVLYEMAAGKPPFEGESASDVIAAILKTEPPRLTSAALEVPAELQRIVKKALRKDRDERYQTIKDMALDLKNLGRELDIASEVELASQPADGKLTARTEIVTPAHPTSSAEYIASQIKEHTTGVLIAVAALVFAAAGIAFGIYKYVGRNRSEAKVPGSFQTMNVTKLTTSGNVFVSLGVDVAISPDGKYVAYAIEDAGKQSVWMRQVATSGNVQIIPPAETYYIGLTFSRDGNYIYYVKAEDKDRSKGDLYQMPIMGGVSRKITTDVGSPITFSPDGQRFAFIRRNSDQDTELNIARSDGAYKEQTIARRKLPDDLQLPAWSPDGKSIACATNLASKITEVKIEGGEQRTVGSKEWFDITQIAWETDGTGLVISGTEKGRIQHQIWRLSYPDGEARRITNDSNDYVGLALSMDSGTLATVQIDFSSAIWLVPSGDTSRAARITTNKVSTYPRWTPDNRVLYSSAQTPDGTQIWIMNADGSNQKQLTFDYGSSSTFSVSTDGRFIFFVHNSFGTGYQNIWRVDIDGGNPKQLTYGKGFDVGGKVTPNGQWVLYASNASGKSTIWKVPFDGGTPVQVTSNVSVQPAISPDGTLIACFYQKETNSPLVASIIPFDGKVPSKTFDIPFNPELGPEWATDGRSLLYRDTKGGFSNIWSQPLDGGPPKQLTDFKTDQIFSFDLSRDGKLLAIARGTMPSDVVLITNLR